MYSDILHKHTEHLRAVFESLRQAKLVARPSKCSIGFRELEFLGHVAGNGTLKPVQDKIAQ